MKKPSQSQDEQRRLDALARLQILDTDAERSFDEITKLAATICDAKYGFITLIDRERQWFKSKFGTNIQETARSHSFCNFAIASDQLMEVSDATLDARFANHSWVKGEMGVRFYAGHPLITTDGFRIGTLCVYGVKPKNLTDQQKQTLQVLSHQVVHLMELRNNRQLLADLNRQLEEAQRISRIGSWQMNLKTQQLTWSIEHYRIFELTYPQPQAELYELYRSRIHPDDLKTLDQGVADAIKKGEGFVYDHRVVLDGGARIKYVQGIGSVTLDEQGQPYLLTGTCRDRTQEVEAEAILKAVIDDLARSQERFHFALEATGEGVWDWIVTTDKVSHNAQWCRLLGLDDRFLEHALKDFADLIHPEDQTVVMARLQDCLSGKCDYASEHRLKRADGEYIWVLDRGKVVTRDAQGAPLRMVGSFRDITRMRDAQHQLIQSSKLASLGQMAAGVAHEINNPLTIIEGCAMTVEKQMPEAADKMATIHRAVQRIAKIVRGLRKYSRSSEREKFASHQLKSILQEALALTDHKSKMNEVAVRLQCSEKLKIYCNEIEIEQVFINLVSNAIDAVKELKERWVDINVTEETGHIVVRVRDSGKGIPIAVAEKLFDPFFTTKEVGSGTGLGLSITKGILEEHEASIRLLTNDAHTCFEISFRPPKAIKAAA